jgi:hypothetical protein
MPGVADLLAKAGSKYPTPERPRSVAEKLAMAGAENAPVGTVLRQAASSFVGNVNDVLNTVVRAPQRLIPDFMRPEGLTPEIIAEERAKIDAEIVPDPVPGQEGKFYSKVAGMAGQTAAFAPLALAGGAPAVAGVGALMGAEHGIEEAQAAGATGAPVVYNALGQAFIQAVSTYGPAGAFARFGVNGASRGILAEMLQSAAVGGAQHVGSDVVAKATYDPERTVDLGEALETAMAMGTVGGAAHGTAKLLEIAARQHAREAPQTLVDETGNAPDFTQSVSPEADASQPVLPESVAESTAAPVEQVTPSSVADASTTPQTEQGAAPAEPLSRAAPLAQADEVAAPVSTREPWHITSEEYETRYPRAGARSGEYEVGRTVPNQDSIDSSIENPTVVKGIREVPMSEFGTEPPNFYSVTEEARTKALAEEIRSNKRIDPLIVGYDQRGPYILEGGHRFNALKLLGAKSFPAKIVFDEGALHRAVLHALKEGRPVPPEVLAEYPDLASNPAPGGAEASPAVAPEAVGGALAPPGEGPARGIKHAKIDESRAEFGIDPAKGRERKADVDLHARARAKIEADPFAGAKLVDELEATNRVPDDEQGTLIGLEITRLANERAAAQKAHIEAPTPETQARIDAVKAAYARTSQIARSAGSERGAALRNQQLMFESDYSLAQMESETEIAKGEPLTAAESKRVEELHARITKAEESLSAIDLKQRELEAENAMLRLKQEVRQRAPAKQRARTDRIAQNRARMEELLKELASPTAHSGVDPAKLVKIVEFAKLAIENGVLKFADFVAEVSKAGEHVKPYLEKAWNEAVKAHIDELAGPVRERIAKGEKPGRYMHELARHFVEQGVTEREPLIDAVHKILPEMKREQVRDAISGYGEFRAASKEETDVRLRQLKQEMQKVAQIEALEKRIAPLKTGFERGEPSDEYRRLTKRANELRQQAGIKVLDPEKALKTALDTRETRLTNRIADLRHEIATGKLEARNKGEPPTNERIKALEAELASVQAEHDAAFAKPAKSESEKEADAIKRRIEDLDERIKTGDTSARHGKATVDTAEVAAARRELEAKRAQLDAMRKASTPAKPDPRIAPLRKQVAELHERIEKHDLSTRGPKQGPEPVAEVAALKAEREALSKKLADMRKPTDAEKDARSVEASIKAVEKSIADYDARIAAGNVAPKPGVRGPTSLDLEALRFHRRAKAAELEELRALQNPKATPEEIARKAYLTRVANETAKLRERTSYGDFVPRVKTERPLSAEELTAKAEREKVRREYERDKFRFEQANRSTTRKVIAAAGTALNLPKALWSSFDVSAVFRQGAFFSGQDLFFRPVQFAARIGRMFRAMASEDYATKVDVQIREHPLYPVAKKAGLELTGMNDPLTAREEYFQSALADKIPGLKQSERAYVGYLNMLRFDHFRRIVASTDGSPQAAKAVANLVNVATGRGAVGHGAFARAMPAAGTVLWAPRLYISRFQLLAGQPLMRGGARMAVAREYAASLAALGSVYALVGLYKAMNPDDDVTVSTDPTSPDGGKIKIGDTRIDPLAGLQQATRLVAREGRIVAGDSKEDAAGVALTFLRTKVSPAISLPYSLATGKDLAYGRAIDRAEVARDALIPLSLRDIRDAMEAQGVPKGLALGMLSLFGVGLNTYSDKKKKPVLEARR